MLLLPVEIVVDTLAMLYVQSLIKLLPSLLETSRHLGFYAVWVNTVLVKHGQKLKERAPEIISELSHLQKALTTHHDNLSKVLVTFNFSRKFLNENIGLLW